MTLVQLLTWIAIGILVFLAFLVVSILLARLRNELAIGVINNIFAIIAWPFKALNGLINWLVDQMGTLIDWANKGMKHAWERIGENQIAHNLGALDVLSAGFFFLLLLVLVAGDAFFTAIRIPELFGVTPPDFNPDFFTPITVLYWVSVIIAVVAACADIFGLTHLLPPYVGANKNQDVRKYMRIGALVALGLLILGGILQGLFTWELANSAKLPLVDGALNVVFIVLGFVAAGVLGIAVAYEALGFLVIVPSLLRIVPMIVAFLLNMPLGILDRAADLLVRLYDALAALGKSFWNWLSNSTAHGKWSIGNMPNYEPRPRIGS